MNKPLWTSDDIIKITHGDCAVSFGAGGVSIDSRSIKKGEFFVAIDGENNDGHDYVKSAFKNGAAAAIVSKKPKGIKDDQPLVFVSDTKEALKNMAEFARKRTSAKIIAITGSVGKTGTKEMLAHALSNQTNIYKSPGNFNNYFGLPVSLANMPKDAAVGVFEVGMSEKGEISDLVQLIKPHIAIITNVAHAHLMNFKDLEEIAHAKSEIFETSPETAIIPTDIKHTSLLYKKAKDCGVKNIITFGTSRNADVRLLDANLTSKGCFVNANLREKKLNYTIGVYGVHWAGNSLAALAAIDALNADIKPALEALKTFEEPAGRGKIYAVNVAKGIFYLIDDAYNACPLSMAAAFEKLHMLHEGSTGKAIAVLGDMLEMGEKSQELHKQLAPLILENEIDKVYTVGDNMEALYNELPENIRGGYADNASDIIPLLLLTVRPEDTVLVKGSNGMGLKTVVTALLQLDIM